MILVVHRDEVAGPSGRSLADSTETAVLHGPPGALGARVGNAPKAPPRAVLLSNPATFPGIAQSVLKFR